MFHYDVFIRQREPSEKRLDLLFPGNPVTKVAFLDSVVEQDLLLDYVCWARAKKSLKREDKALWEFYSALIIHLDQDSYIYSRHQEKYPYQETFARWEYAYLDQDLGTKKLEHYRMAGKDVFSYHTDVVRRQAWDKYKHI